VRQPVRPGKLPPYSDSESGSAGPHSVKARLQAHSLTFAELRIAIDLVQQVAEILDTPASAAVK